MVKFTQNAEPVIKNKELQNHYSDKLATELKKEAKSDIKSNEYIKRNIRTVHAIERENKKNKERPESASWVHRTGEVPVYLANRKKEAEQERMECLK